MDLLLLAITRQTGRRLAEIAFLLVVFAGIWLAAAQMPRYRWAAGRTAVAGVALAAAGVLLLVAVHWGRFG